MMIFFFFFLTAKEPLLIAEGRGSPSFRAGHIWVQILPQVLTGAVILSKLQKTWEPFQV